MTNVKAIKLTNFKAMVEGGYVLVSGWALARTDGALYTNNGTVPYLSAGGRSAAKAVEATGLMDGARFMRAA